MRDLTTILEAMGDIAPITKDPDVMIEAVRAAHRPRHLPSAPERSRRAADDQFRSVSGGAAAPVDRPHGAGRGARAGPSRKRRVWPLESPARSRPRVAQPVLLCTPALRPHLWRLFTRVLPHIGVLSHNEIPAHVRIAPVAVLD